MQRIELFFMIFVTILFVSDFIDNNHLIYAQETNTQTNSSLVETEEEEDDELGFDEEFEEEFDSFGDDVFDPLSGYNRVMTEFNDGFYVYVLDPVARGYRWAIPLGGRRGINRFFHNLFFPIRFVNNVLQLKVKNAGEEFLRFCINSTIGIFGIWDPAKEWFDLYAHDEDFGQTLGYYGIGGGFHIVLPF